MTDITMTQEEAERTGKQIEDLRIENRKLSYEKELMAWDIHNLIKAVDTVLRPYGIYDHAFSVVNEKNTRKSMRLEDVFEVKRMCEEAVRKAKGLE